MKVGIRQTVSIALAAVLMAPAGLAAEVRLSAPMDVEAGKRLIESALAAQLEGNHTVALREYSRALEAYPNEPLVQAPIYRALSEEARASGDAAQSKVYLEMAKSIDSGGGEPPRSAPAATRGSGETATAIGQGALAMVAAILQAREAAKAAQLQKQMMQQQLMMQQQGLMQAASPAPALPPGGYAFPAAPVGMPGFMAPSPAAGYAPMPGYGPVPGQPDPFAPQPGYPIPVPPGGMGAPQPGYPIPVAPGGVGMQQPGYPIPVPPSGAQPSYPAPVPPMANQMPVYPTSVPPMANQPPGYPTSAPPQYAQQPGYPPPAQPPQYAQQPGYPPPAQPRYGQTPPARYAAPPYPYGAPRGYAPRRGAMRGTEMKPLRVVHDHASLGDAAYFADGCGALIAFADNVLTFTPSGGESPLVIPAGEVADVRLNAVIGREIGAFHILTRKGLYLQLAAESGKREDARAAVDGLRKQLGLGE